MLQAVPQMPLIATAESADAIFQAIITGGLALFAVGLYRRVRQRWFAWWAAAWGLYVLRLLAIIAFLGSGDLAWLFWHQVVTGWVALAILWAALVFSHDLPWRRWYALLGALPLVWAWIAVAGLDRFLLAALPMVLFLSGVTLWTGWVFWKHYQRSGSSGAAFVSLAFLLWGLHHLDYPFLRARGAWEPWGYYLDIVFELAVGIGFGMMVLSDLAKRLGARTADLGRLSVLMVRQHESERRRLSRDLHDETAQTLSAVKLEVGMLREGAPLETQARLDHVLSLVDGGIRGIRRVMNDLRPALLDDLGLVPAIRSLADDLRGRSALRIDADLPAETPRLPAETELALFRAAQEALANVVRHAGATRVTITLRHDGPWLRLVIRDDGRGFPSGTSPATFEQAGHLGLAGMRERIAALDGTVTVTGEGGGVAVMVEVPVGTTNAETTA